MTPVIVKQGIQSLVYFLFNLAIVFTFDCALFELVQNRYVEFDIQVQYLQRLFVLEKCIQQCPRAEVLVFLANIYSSP